MKERKQKELERIEDVLFDVFYDCDPEVRYETGIDKFYLEYLQGEGDGVFWDQGVVLRKTDDEGFEKKNQLEYYAESLAELLRADYNILEQMARDIYSDIVDDINGVIRED